MQYLVLLIIFAAVFLLTLQFFPEKSERLIRQRIAPQLLRQRRRRSVLAHLLGVIAPLNKPLALTPFLASFREKLKVSLASAGNPLTVSEFFAFKELCAIFPPALYIIIIKLENVQVLWLIVAMALGLIVPDLWLKHKIRLRQEVIAKALPDVIDLLNLAVGAGLDFMVAVKKMMQRCKPGPLIDELSQVWQETNIGKTRREALRNMARRVNMPEISSFARTLIQADKMGTSIEEALRIQSEEVMDARFQRGERAALKAPIKLLFPLVAFILPVVLIVVAGPILLQFLKGGLNMAQF